MDNDVFNLTVEVQQVAPIFPDDIAPSGNAPVLAETPEDSFAQVPVMHQSIHSLQLPVGMHGNGTRVNYLCKL